MDCLTTLPFLLLLLLCFFTSSYATSIEVHNNCPFTVWAAATPIGGGRRLDRGQNWTINIPPNSKPGSVWGRTNCNFDGSGRGSCQTGDCGGVLRCTDEAGKPPKTLVEYSLNQFNNLDFYDISLVNGFNIPLSFSPTKPIDKCRAISCTADIVGQCPAALRDPGGCNNPCTVFGTPGDCCTNSTCNPSYYSRFFKTNCPDGYRYPMDDATSTFTCPGGTTDYRVVFCPLN